MVILDRAINALDILGESISVLADLTDVMGSYRL